MTDRERNLLVRALQFYRDERQLDDLPRDKNLKYYDYDRNGKVTYSTADAIDANNMEKLLSTFD